MLKKKIMPFVLAATMTVGLAAPFSVPAFAHTEREKGRTPDIVQDNRVYINGDEINAYRDAEGTIYVPAMELEGYGFDVDDSFNVSWAGTTYDFDESYMPTTENGGMEDVVPAKTSVTVNVGGVETPLYTIEGQECIEAKALEVFGYGEYNLEKRLYNLYVEDAGYMQNVAGFRNITVDASDVTGSFKKILGMHYDPGEEGSETRTLYLLGGTDGLRTHDIDGTSGDGRGIIYNLVPGYFDTIKAINLLELLKENGGTYVDPEDPVLVNLYPASRVYAEVEKCVAAGLITDSTGNYDEQIAALQEKLAAIDLRSEEAYDFEETDKVIKNALDIGADILFRFGASQNDIIDNTFPPVDSEEWDPFVENLGIIAEQIVKHYNQGWDNGFDHVLSYFEIWNEADLLDFWPNFLESGAQAYYEMYDTVGKAVKSVDPELPVGGPTITTHNDERGLEESFLKFVKENGSPLDFFSFHYYPSVNADPYDYARWANHFEVLLQKYGFGDVPLFLSEYGTNIFGNPFTMDPNAQNTFHTAALIYMQQSIIERAYSYGRFTGREGGMGSTYYAYTALQNFQDTDQMLAVTGGDKNGMAVLAGTNEDNSRFNVVIANYELPASQMLSNATDESHNPIIVDGKLIPPNQVAKWSLPLGRVMTYENNSGYNLTIENLPYEGLKNVFVEIYQKDAENDYELVDRVDARVKDNSVTISKDLLPYSYNYISIVPGEQFMTGWQNINGFWHFFDENGDMQFGWVNDGTAWYRTDPDTGKMQTGWMLVNGEWYYMAPSGQMQTGWQKIDGVWYYFNSAGAMASYEWVDGYWLNVDGSWTYPYTGSWKQNNQGWWFGDTSGWFAKGISQTINGTAYSFDANGYWIK